MMRATCHPGKRLKSVAVLLALALSGCWPSMGCAANTTTSLPTLLKNMRPMQVQIVRTSRSDCVPNCAQWISAEGDIVESTTAEFRRILDRIGTRKLPVFVNSGGGSIEAAMAIGQMLRAHGLDVSVTRTAFVPCRPHEKDCGSGKSLSLAARGLPDSFNAYCASACTLVLAAGTQRLASAWSHVGVHQIIVFKTQFRVRRTYRVTTLRRPSGGTYVRRTLIREQNLSASTTQLDVNDGTYRPMDNYLQQMGVNISIVQLMEATPNSDIHWMTHGELEATGIVTRHQSGDTLFKVASLLPALSFNEPTSLASSSSSAISDPHAEVSVLQYFQGRPVSLHLAISYVKTLSQIVLSVDLKDGDAAIRSQGIFATIGLGLDHSLNAYSSDWAMPYSPLAVRAHGSSVCALRQNRTMQLSLHPVRPQAGELLPLEDTAPVEVNVASVPGLAELLVTACSTVAVQDK